MNHNHDRTSGPIFVLGVSRSGTTLLSGMLDAHSKIAIPYESHFFTEYERRYGSRILTVSERAEVREAILGEPYVKRWDWAPDAAAISVLKCDTLTKIIRQIFRLYAAHFNKQIWGDKTPSYIDQVDALYRLFPDGRFIHVVRDGRDVALSVVQQWWGPNDFLSCLNWWAAQVKTARRMLDELPAEQVLEVKLEILAQSPEQELRRVMSFLGLEFEAGTLTGYANRAAARVGNRIKQHHAGLAKSISVQEVTRWPNRLCAADQALAWQSAGDLLGELGYPSGVTKHPLVAWRRFAHRLLEAWHWRIGTSNRRKERFLAQQDLPA